MTKLPDLMVGDVVRFPYRNIGTIVTASEPAEHGQVISFFYRKNKCYRTTGSWGGWITSITRAGVVIWERK